MTRSLDTMTARSARYQDSRSADRFMTRIRLLLNDIDPERPMPAEQRDELRKLRWFVAEAIDNVLEDDMRLAVSLNPAEAVRKIHAIASAYVLTSEMAGQQKEAAE